MLLTHHLWLFSANSLFLDCLESTAICIELYFIGNIRLATSNLLTLYFLDNFSPRYTGCFTESLELSVLEA